MRIASVRALWNLTRTFFLPILAAPILTKPSSKKKTTLCCDRALQKLPPSFREVIVLRELEGMSYREIADITGMPAGTVMSSLSRARGRLRAGFDGSYERTCSANFTANRGNECMKACGRDVQ